MTLRRGKHVEEVLPGTQWSAELKDLLWDKTKCRVHVRARKKGDATEYGPPNLEVYADDPESDRDKAVQMAREIIDKQ